MSLTLEIVTPEKKVFQDTVESVVLPTESGEIGILPGHIPLLTVVKPGNLHITRAGSGEDLAVDKGFARIMGDTISVLTEAAINVEEIDVGEVEAAQARAEKALEQARDAKEIDPGEIEKLEAIVRFSIAQKLIKKKKL